MGIDVATAGRRSGHRDVCSCVVVAPGRGRPNSDDAGPWPGCRDLRITKIVYRGHYQCRGRKHRGFQVHGKLLALGSCVAQAWLWVGARGRKRYVDVRLLLYCWQRGQTQRMMHMMHVFYLGHTLGHIWHTDGQGQGSACLSRCFTIASSPTCLRCFACRQRSGRTAARAQKG